MIGLYLALFLALWCMVPLWFHIPGEPPDDNLEQLAWAHQPAWGYAKHPPFPSLLLWVVARVLPNGVWLTYALGAFDVAIMLFAAFALARETLDPARAWIGVLLITCITFYTRRLHFYNHNTALLAAYAVSLLCVWRAVRTGAYGWWAAVGLCWAVGLLSKYQMIIGIATNLVFIWDSRSRESARWLWGTMLASATAGLLLIPHVQWLVAHDFLPLHYAAKYVAAGIAPLDRPMNVAHFIVNQITRVVPLALVLGALYWKLQNAGARSTQPTPEATNGEVARLGRRMLVVHAWGPLLIMSALALLFGVDLEMHWGTAFLWMLPLWFLATRPGQRLATLPPLAVSAIVALAQLFMLTEFAFLHW